MVVPASELSLNAGCLQAFAFLLEAFHLKAFLPGIALIVAIGAVGSMSTWIVGPCSGLISASEETDLPPLLTKLNHRKVPQNLLICQAFLVTSLSLVFLFMPNINNAYWMLLILTTQLYLIMYIFFFAAAIKLRYKFPHIERPFQVPGGKLGMWIFAGLGIVSSLFTFGIAFYPPENMSPETSFKFTSFLVISIVTLCAVPYLSRKFFQKPMENVSEDTLLQKGKT
jgi:amino acid transporter